MAYSSVRATLGGKDVRKTSRQTKKKRKPSPRPAFYTPLKTAKKPGYKPKTPIGKTPKKYRQKSTALPSPKVVKGPTRRAEKRRASARVVRRASRAGLLRDIQRDIRRTSKREQRKAEEASKSFGERLLESGVVGLVDKDVSADVRKKIWGTKDPSPLEVGLAAGAPGAGRLATRVFRGAKAAKGTQRAKPKALEERLSRKGTRRLEGISKAEAKRRRAPRKVRAKEAGGAAKARAARRVKETPARAKSKALRRVQRLQTPQAVGAATVLGGTPVGAATEALIEGHLTADPKKAGKTTARVIPASLAFLGTAAADVGRTGYRAAQTAAPGGKSYTGKEILDPVKGTGKAALAAGKALGPLVSGDPEKVKEAVEEDVGYMFVPVVPRVGAAAAATRVARAGGRGIKGAGRKVVPAGVRHARPVQVVTGRGTRKRVSRMAGQEVHAAAYRAARAERDVIRPLRKAKKARSLRNLKGMEAGDAVSVLARYGVSRKNPLPQLRRIKSTLRDTKGPKPDATTRSVIEFLEKNPEVLRDAKLWEAVDNFKKRAQEIETSPRAKYLAQARVVSERSKKPILKPEERAPARAQELTGEASREGAWRALKDKQKALQEAKGNARRTAIRAQEAKGARREELRDIAAAHRRDTKRLAEETREIHKSLRGFSRPGTEPSIRLRRKPWDARMVREFVEETKGRAKGMEEPAFVAEPRLPTEGQIAPQFPVSGSRAVHVKTGKAEAFDLADRSLRALVRGSVVAPRIQQGLHRLTRRFLDSEARPVPGMKRKVITGQEWNKLVQAGKVDPREVVLLPSRQFKQALKAENFDLPQFHTDLSKRLERELHDLGDAPGTKYVMVGREAATEFVDQISPKGGRLEAALSATGKVSSRTILGLSPAWAISQVVAEGTQAFAAQGIGFLRALGRVERFRRRDPEGYEAFAALAGESLASFDMPSSLRVSMDAGMQTRFSNASRAVQRTAVGRALHGVGTVKLLGLFDRWKGGKYRSAVLAAKVDRELNGFLRGLQGVTRSQGRIAPKLKGMSRQEQLSWMARNPKALQKHVEYLDDVLGNWHAYTRFERTFAPALVFYPYLRMSLRWAFWSFPKRHPVKSTILYTFAQKNSEELERLLGAPLQWQDYAQPIVHGDEGEADLVLPAGRRFGTPALNVLVEAFGEGETTRVVQALNPLVSIGITSLTGVEPFTGKQVAEEDTAKGLLALRQLLSLAAPARALGSSRIGKEETDVSQAFQTIDPKAKFRSLINPLQPLTVNRAAMKADLIRILKELEGPTQSDFIKARKAGDEDLTEELKRQRRRSVRMQERLEQYTGPDTKAEKKAVSEGFSDYYGSGETKKSTAKPSKKPSSYDSVFGGGGGGGGGGSSSYEKVFGR